MGKGVDFTGNGGRDVGSRNMPTQPSQPKRSGSTIKSPALNNGTGNFNTKHPSGSIPKGGIQSPVKDQGI